MVLQYEVQRSPALDKSPLQQGRSACRRANEAETLSPNFTVLLPPPRAAPDRICFRRPEEKTGARAQEGKNGAH